MSDTIDYKTFVERINKRMRFQIVDGHGNVVDRNLTYEEAVLWIDQTDGDSYAMEPMKRRNK